MEKGKSFKKKVSNAISQFNKLSKAAVLLGFDLQTTMPLAIRNAALRSYLAPKTKRGEVTLHGVSYKKDLDGLAIYLHIPYNNKDQDFYRVNEAWIVVTDSLPVIKGKRYYREPLRCYGKNFAQNIILHLRAVEWCIRHRPVSVKTTVPSLMVPFRNKAGKHEFVTRKNGRIIERKNFFISLPHDPELTTYVTKFIARKKATIKRRIATGATPMQKIRKKHKVQTTSKNLNLPGVFGPLTK